MSESERRRLPLSEMFERAIWFRDTGRHNTTELVRCVTERTFSSFRTLAVHPPKANNPGLTSP
jgi:hypothetical protein